MPTGQLQAVNLPVLHAGVAIGVNFSCGVAEMLVLCGQNCTYSAFSFTGKEVQQTEAGLKLHLVAVDGEGASE